MPLTSPDISFSAFETLGLAAYIFLKPFLSCTLEAPKLLRHVKNEQQC